MKRRMLLVDDDANLLHGLGRTLHTMTDDWETVLAANGRDAIRLLALDPYDIVITNILMPEQEGLETIRELQCRFPTVKIIAMSGGGQIGRQNILNLARHFGAHWTLPKPFNTEELLAAIRGVLLNQE